MTLFEIPIGVFTNRAMSIVLHRSTYRVSVIGVFNHRPGATFDDISNVTLVRLLVMLALYVAVDDV